MTTMTPYLFFNGRCEEAIDFYKRALDAEVVMLMRFNESPESLPEGAVPPDFDNKVMHATLSIRGIPLMVSDGCEIGANFAGFRLHIHEPTEDEARTTFNALADGGTIDLPIGPTFWSPCYGMVTDKFGTPWMVSVATEEVAE